MRLTFTLLFTLFLLASTALQAQDKHLIDYRLIEDFTLERVKEKWKKDKLPKIIVPYKYAYKIYDIDYWTTYHDGSRIKASGVFYVPQGVKKPLSTILYNHGTAISPKRKLGFNGEETICMIYATDGYMVLFPDYMGLGRGEKFHIYQHVETEAQANIDLLRAVRELYDELGVKVNDDLFITGYSQGGHATLATHKVMQEKHPEEFKVTASSPMSGAYDMNGVQSETMFKEYTQPHYLPYLLYGYQEVYGVIDGDINDIFRSPYDTLIPKMFDEQHDRGSINRALPKIPKDMIVDELIEEFVNNPEFKFTVALEENNLYDWKPEAPVQLCYCEGDEEVYYKNSIKAYEHMKQRGAKRVLLRHGGKKFKHQKCAHVALNHTKWFFDSIRKGKEKGRKGPMMKRFILNIGKNFI